MRPQRLIIEGLNSFYDKQVIDFKALTSSGLFGIFGKTGAGKSTILDAVMLALYGEIPRQSKNYVNTNRDNLYILFEFAVSQGADEKVYSIERKIKRDKNGSIKTQFARLIQNVDGTEDIITDRVKDVKQHVFDILGLTAEDFMRSVVLPQGKFSEFLKLKGKERRNMLERIFDLEKFGRKILDKLRLEKSHLQNQISNLEGQLIRFENINQEQLDALKNQLREEESRNNSLLEKVKENEEDYQKGKTIKSYIDEKKKLEEVYQMLLKKEEEINSKEEKYERAVLANGQKEDIIVYKTLTKDQEMVQQELLQSKETQKKKNVILTELTERFDKISNSKEIEYPLLVGKEREVKRIIEVEKTLKMLEEEIDKIEAFLEQSDQSYFRIGKNLEKVLQDLETCNLSVKADEEIAKKLSYEPEYKKAAYDGWQLEVMASNLQEDMTVTTNEIKSLQIKKEQINIEIAEVSESQQTYQKSLNEILAYKHKYQKNYGDSINKLLLTQEKIANLTKTVKEYEIGKEELLKATKEKNTLVGQITADELSMRKGQSLLEQKKILMEELNSLIKKDEIQQMAKHLAKDLEDGKPCPVCGSCHHEEVVFAKEEQSHHAYSSQYEKVLEDMEVLEKKLQPLKISWEVNKTQLNKVQSLIHSWEQKLEVIKNTGDIEKRLELMEEKKIKEQDISKLKDTLETTEKAIEKQQAVVQKQQKAYATKIETLRSMEMNLKEKIVKQEQNKDKYQGIQKQLISLGETFKIKDFKKEKNKIEEDERKLNKILQQIKDNTKKIDELKEIEQQNQEKKNKLNIRVVKAKSILEEKKNQQEVMRQDILTTLEGKQGSKYLQDIQNRITQIQNEYKEVLETLKIEKELKEQNDNALIKLTEKLGGMTKQYEALANKLQEFLKRSSFESIEAVERGFLGIETLEIIKNEVQLYRQEKRDLEVKNQDLKEKLNGATLTSEEWTNIVEAKKVLGNSIQQSNELIVQLKLKVKQIQNEIVEKRRLEGIKDSLDKRNSLLMDLEKLFKGNRFVEYVAKNQLRYITLEASRRLADITGRYAIELDDQGEFVIRDDKNGGVLREPQTLSGGETFVTSLALALALSSHIQLKGRMPLEFFFLDEGFGSLDQELLDVVFHSLEKLQHGKMSVGIISHVEALKERVPVKLIVDRPKYDEIGSSVRLEYT